MSATLRCPKENRNRATKVGRVQKRALGLLFIGLAAALVVVAVAAFLGASGAARWVIAVAAVALAAWMGSNALSVLRK